MKSTYAANAGAGPTYDIEADRHGNYTISQEGKVLKRVTSVTSYVGRPRWGSRKLEQSAMAEAIGVIDAHHAHEARQAHRQG